MLVEQATKWMWIGLLLFGACASREKSVISGTGGIGYGVDWKFNAGEGDKAEWSASLYDDTGWQKVVSDKTLTKQGVSLKHSFGWYRKHIRFSKTIQQDIRQSGAAILDLGTFAACEEVYINGKLIGKTGEFPDDYAGYNDHHRKYYVDATDFDLNGNNVIAIKFHDGWSGNGGFLDGAGLVVSPATILDKISLQVVVQDDDYIFLGQDSIALLPCVENKNKQAIQGTLVVRLLTDDFQEIKEEHLKITVPAQTVFKQRMFGLSNPKPGFYRYDVTFSLSENEQINQKLNVGYEPEKILSPNDQREDFDIFWQENLKELAGIAPEFQLTPLPEQSKAGYEMYEVSMRSLEHELIRGYYAKPKQSGKHPVIVEYMGYGSSPYFPNQTWDGFAYFVLSIRGQALNKSGNRFETWFTYGIDRKETYYYRGAFMDVVRALDFVSSRPEIDADRIVVRGSSQGGALSVASASLDKRVRALAIGIPFLSDYKDYFQICSWPRSDVEAYLREHPEISWTRVYQTLSYFDIKNLASKITVPVIMGIGVQDEVCPPHINFAAYNQIAAPKQWLAFGKYGHSTGKEFYEASMKLFREQLNVTKP